MSETAEKTGPPAIVKRWVPVLALAVGLGLFLAFGLQDFVSIQALRENRDFLMNFVAERRMLAIGIYMAIYIVAIAFSVPGGLLMTVTGGFLFGAVAGTVAVVVAATIGASLLFLAARTALGNVLREKAGPWLGKLQDGFSENAFSYLLVLRLVPLFPFFIVNIVPAFLGVTLRSYFIATLIGVVPATAVFATFGAGIGSVFDQGGELSFSGVMTPEMVAGLFGLAVLALIPIAYKKFARKP